MCCTTGKCLNKEEITEEPKMTTAYLYSGNHFVRTQETQNGVWIRMNAPTEKELHDLASALKLKIEQGAAAATIGGKQYRLILSISTHVRLFLHRLSFVARRKRAGVLCPSGSHRHYCPESSGKTECHHIQYVETSASGHNHPFRRRFIALHRHQKFVCKSFFSRLRYR